MFKTISSFRKISILETLFVWVLFTLIACGLDPQAAARKKLANQNISVSPQSLFKAIEMGDVQNTFLLLEAGIDINVHIDKKTPLIAAIELGEQKVVDHLLTQWVPDVTMKQNNGRTALMTAVDNSNEGLIVRLLGFGANIDAPLNDGMTPLMRAVLKGRYKLVDILLKSGANPNLKNIKNETAFSIAEDRNDKKILRLLKNVKN